MQDCSPIRRNIAMWKTVDICHIMQFFIPTNQTSVVFDCTAHKHETSLNKQLLPRLDLLNSLIGVFSHFRKGRIALVADIEAMYHPCRSKRPKIFEIFVVAN